jgi:hypothetical protein
LLYGTLVGSAVGFVAGVLRNIGAPDGGDYWLVDGIFLSAIGAVIGLVVGVFRDVFQS